MMIALPNTGTDWLTSLLCKNNRLLVYHREFFNPICNKNVPEIGKLFGCELNWTHSKITKPHTWEQYQSLIKETWKPSGYNFTKENFSAFHLNHHRKVFDCFVLFRELEDCLPSNGTLKRVQDVKSWYDAIYQSMKINEDTLEPEIARLFKFAKENAVTKEMQLCSAHIIAYHKTMMDAEKYNFPIIKYKTLMDGNYEEVRDHLNCIKMMGDMDGLTREIIATRKARESKFDTLLCNEYVQQLRGLINDNQK